MVGSTLGIAVVTAVAVSQTDHLLAGGTPPMLARVEGFQVALAVAAGLAVLGLLAALTLLGPRHRNEVELSGSMTFAAWSTGPCKSITIDKRPERHWRSIARAVRRM